ncbi:hypothetical protein [Acinetobacter seifertii]|uniref:hypothetical protein n=1 Tax=Acinetobacter seifertii TaxID=1530123 RepID=UPI0027DD29B8|nr:hypothetical protein [Acinetobacter seifertii]
MHLVKLDDLEEINKIILNEHVQKDICDDPTRNEKVLDLSGHEWIGVVEDNTTQGLFYSSNIIPSQLKSIPVYYRAFAVQGQ